MILSLASHLAYIKQMLTYRVYIPFAIAGALFMRSKRNAWKILKEGSENEKMIPILIRIAYSMMTVK